MLGVIFLLNLVVAVFAFADGDTERAIWHCVYLLFFAAMFTTVPYQARVRLRAATAHQHAQNLLAAPPATG